MGWTLGIAETVAAVIVIGFSIDYTLHIGHMYQESDRPWSQNSRKRTQYALEKMGSTVLAGAHYNRRIIYVYVCLSNDLFLQDGCIN